MDIDEIIEGINKKLQLMLKSVYRFNSNFDLDGREELLRRIIKAMKIIDRKYFIDNNPYVDTALSIGDGQTISQPSTVARMLVLLGLGKGDRVLEIGTGSGWNASLIAYLVRPGKVDSMERISSLTEKARKNINELKKNLDDGKFLDNINLISGNIFYKKKGRYDKIIFTAGIKREEEKIKKLARKLLNKGGRLICPYQSGPILIYDKNGELKKSQTKEMYGFVPLVG